MTIIKLDFDKLLGYVAPEEGASEGSARTAKVGNKAAPSQRTSKVGTKQGPVLRAAKVGAKASPRLRSAKIGAKG